MLLAGDDDGLSARFLYAWPSPRRPSRPKSMPDAAAALRAARRLVKLPSREHAVPMLPEAADVLQAWRETIATMESGAAGLYLSWLGKCPGSAVRLALVLERLWWAGDRPGTEEPKAISARAVAAAIGLLMTYALPMARRTFGDAALPVAARDAAILARWLLSPRPIPASVNARDLRQRSALPTRLSAWFDAALAELQDAGWVRPLNRRIGDTAAGRPRKDWAVNPRSEAVQ